MGRKKGVKDIVDRGVYLKCTVCGKTFRVRKYREDTAKFCSRKCCRGEHGLTGTRYFLIWQHIKARCFNPKNKAYKNYGGRGITISPLWVNNAESFCKYIASLPNSDNDTLSLDRINNEGNYEVGNLRWASRQTQNLNRRSLKNKSGYIGVYYDKIRGVYESSIMLNNIKIHLGRHLTAINAYNARVDYIIANNIQI